MGLTCRPEREIPTMEQCIDRRCGCITRNSPRNYPGLSLAYQKKLADRQAYLQRQHDKAMAEADKAEAEFWRGLLITAAIVVFGTLIVIFGR